MVYIPLLKKLAIPFGVVTTSSLLFTFESAKAEIKTPFQLGYDIYKQNEINLNLPFAERYEETINVWLSIGKSIYSIQQWFANLEANITKLSVDILSFVFDLVSKMVLITPTFIFNNEYSNNLSLTLSVISITIVTILTMIESIKKMINNKFFKVRYTDYSTILKRWSLAVIGAGFAPFLFEKTFEILNWLSQAISKLAVSGINSSEALMNFTVSGTEAIVLLLFDIVVIALMIPVALQNGRRWWDLFCLSSITPLSLTAWIFDDYKYLHSKWWNKIKQLATTQLVYAIYIALMGILIFSTQIIQTDHPFDMYAKLLLIIGGLLSMTDIPKFVLSKVDNGGNILEECESTINKIRDMYETVTLKKIKRKLTNPVFKNAKGTVSGIITKNPVLTKNKPIPTKLVTGKRYNP